MEGKPYYLIVGAETNRGGTGKKYKTYAEAVKVAKEYVANGHGPKHICAPIALIEIERPPVRVTPLVSPVSA